MKTKIINQKSIPPIQNECGELIELHNSENLSLAHALLKENTKKHKHATMDEVYYILKGLAEITIGDKKYNIQAGDIVSIPKNIFHQVINIKETVYLIAATNPGYDPKDVIQEDITTEN